MTLSPLIQLTWNGSTFPLAIYLGEDGDKGGIVESWGDRGLEVTVHFHCNWSDRISLIQAFRGQVGVDGNGNITRNYPLSLPMLPGSDYRWDRYNCTGTGEFKPIKFRTDQDASVTGLAGWGFYDTVVVPMHFEATPYQTQDGYAPGDQNDPSGLPYTVTTFKPAGEIICPPSGAYTYKSNGAPVLDINAGIYRPRLEIQIKRVFMPVVPVQQLQAIMGTVNGKPIPLGNYSFPKGSMLVTGVETEVYGDAGSGYLVQDVTYTILANTPSNLPGNKQDLTLDWNQIMSSNGSYDYISDKNGNPPFPYINYQSNIWPDYIA